MQQDPPTLQRPSAPATPDGPQLYRPATQSNYVGAPQGQTPAPVIPVGDHTISWEASEYVHNDKGSAWLIGFLLIVVILLGVVLWLHEWTFAAIILVMSITFGVFAFRPPRTLSYILDDEGVEIGGHLYPYSDFRAFGILEDGAFFTMTLLPIKRFSPAISVYFAETDGERIVDLVGDHLPMQAIQPDFIDGIMRRLRF